MGRAAAGTEAALAAAKARGAKANARALDIAPVFDRLDPDGSLSLNKMTRLLTAEGLPIVNGSAVWTAAGVGRVKARLAAAA